MARELKAKKKCCGSDPRCKRCPVVLERLRAGGLAKRRSRRLYVVKPVSKKRLKKIRAR